MSNFSGTLFGMEKVGCLYNVKTGRYACSDSIGTRVIDGLDGNDASFTIPGTDTSYPYPSEVTIQAVSGYDAVSTSSSSTTEYQRSMTIKAGLSASYGAFSGEVETSFSSSSSETSSVWCNTSYEPYYLYSIVVDKSLIGSSTSSNTLKLTSAIETALSNLGSSPSNSQLEAFFDNYGTHVLMGILMGGQLRYSCYASSSAFSSQTAFETSAKAQFNAITATTSFSSTTAKTSSSLTSETGLEIWGGSSSTISNLADQLNQETQDSAAITTAYTAWAESLTSDPEFVDYVKTGESLVPIWELCSNTSTATALQKYYEETYVPLSSNAYFFHTYGDVGNNWAAYDCQWPSASAVSNGFPYVSKALVGFGGRVQDGKGFTRMYVIVWDFYADTYTTEYVGADTDEGYEVNVSDLPKGYAITGLGFYTGDDNLERVAVTSQKLSFDSNGVPYLSTDPVSKTYYKNGSTASKLDSMQLQWYSGIANRGQVISGIAVQSHNGRGLGFYIMSLLESAYNWVQQVSYLKVSGDELQGNWKNYQCQWPSITDLGNTIVYPFNSKILVGLGATINGNTHFSGMWLKVYDLRTKTTADCYSGTPNSSYEVKFDLTAISSDIYAITGLAMREKDNNLQYITVSFQKVLYDSDGNPYLEGTRYLKTYIKGGSSNDNWVSGSDGYETYYFADTGITVKSTLTGTTTTNQQVFTGLALSSTNKGRCNGLGVYVAELNGSST